MSGICYYTMSLVEERVKAEVADQVARQTVDITASLAGALRAIADALETEGS